MVDALQDGLELWPSLYTGATVHFLRPPIYPPRHAALVPPGGLPSVAIAPTDDINALNGGVPPAYAHSLDHVDGREGYGGIWINGRPFQFNAKCVVIGLAVASIYALPRFSADGNLFMMAFLFCLTYIAISWYDVLYHCTPHMYSGPFSITGIFKHQYRTGDTQSPPPGKTLAPNQEKAYLHSVYFAHAAVIAPIVMICAAVALKQRKDIFDEKSVPAKMRSYGIFPVAFGLGALAFFYHTARFIWPREVDCGA